MSNQIRVTALGPRIPHENHPPTIATVDKMIGYWESQFELVTCDQPDLIVVPETCDRFSAMTLDDTNKYYEIRGTKILDYFCEVAQKNKCYLTYSAIRILPNGQKANSTQLIDRNGTVVGVYDKICTVIPETEIKGVAIGTKAPLIECDFGTVACTICFDLNFTELLNNYGSKPDLILFCSNYHGGIMQNYWAYQSRAYFIGAVNDGQNTIINPLGELVGKSTDYYPYITADINLDFEVVHLDGNMAKLQAARKKYGKRIKVIDPGHLGAVLISSEDKTLKIDTIINEFQIELLDDYFDRSRKHHTNHPNKIK